jgi:hypothetical protein
MATDYGLYDQWIEVRVPGGGQEFLLPHFVQRGARAYPASYPMNTGGSFLGDKAAGAWSWPLTSNWYRGHVDLYHHSHVHLHGLVLKYLNTSNNFTLLNFKTILLRKLFSAFVFWLCLPLASGWFLSWSILRSWTWWYLRMKPQLTFMYETLCTKLYVWNQRERNWLFITIRKQWNCGGTLELQSPHLLFPGFQSSVHWTGNCGYELARENDWTARGVPPYPGKQHRRRRHTGKHVTTRLAEQVAVVYLKSLKCLRPTITN